MQTAPAFPMLPPEPDLPVDVLTKVFDACQTSYKYYWFLALLKHFVEDGHIRIRLTDLARSMVAQAWYSRAYCRLSLGNPVRESLARVVDMFSALPDLGLTPKMSYAEVYAGLGECLADRKNVELRNSVEESLKSIVLEVPSRFLRPWLAQGRPNDKKRIRAQSEESHVCLYALRSDEIEIKPVWREYLIQHYGILRAFCYWHLANYMQRKNQGVPGVVSKLVMPQKRESLDVQRKLWKGVFAVSGPQRCIYTGERLTSSFDLDHFYPWRFFHHDELWNLVPVSKSVNSQKHDLFPSLERFLVPFVRQQRLFVRTYKDDNRVMFDDYATIGMSVSELAALTETEMVNLFGETYQAYEVTARRQGFSFWDYGPSAGSSR